MGGRRGEFGVQGGTDVPHTYVKLDLKVADFAEAAEGERAGWRAAELLGAGLAESLLTLQFYSEVSVPRLTLQLTLDQEKKTKNTHMEFCAEHTLTHSSHTHFCSNMHSHTCPPQDLQLDLVPPLETCATLIYSSGSYIQHAVHIVYAHTHTHTLTRCTLLGEESLTFSSITIWKGGYTEARLQRRCITQANILSLTSWRPLGFDTELKIDIVHPHRNRFPCQRCMKMICFNFSSVFRCMRSLTFRLCAHLCVCDTSRHVFLHLILRVCSCKYNLIWMFMEFIELACGSKWFPCRRCYRTDSWSISTARVSMKLYS